MIGLQYIWSMSLGLLAGESGITVLAFWVLTNSPIPLVKNDFCVSLVLCCLAVVATIF